MITWLIVAKVPRVRTAQNRASTQRVRVNPAWLFKGKKRFHHKPENFSVFFFSVFVCWHWGLESVLYLHSSDIYMEHVWLSPIEQLCTSLTSFSVCWHPKSLILVYVLSWSITLCRKHVYEPPLRWQHTRLTKTEELIGQKWNSWSEAGLNKEGPITTQHQAEWSMSCSTPVGQQRAAVTAALRTTFMCTIVGFERRCNGWRANQRGCGCGSGSWGPIKNG